MSIVSNIGHDLKTAGEDVIKGAELVGRIGGDVVKVIEDAKALTPEFKQELAKLVQDAEPLAATLAPVIASEGTDVGLDLAAVAPVLSDIKTLVADFVSFLPTLDKALAELKADVS